MTTWSKNDIFFYYLGMKYSEYPKKIWERIKKENQGLSSILDIGCGPGAFSLPALEDTCKVQAIDINQDHLSALENRCSNIKNLTLVHSDWTDAQVNKADITICAYSLSSNIKSTQGIKKIINYTKNTAYFISFINQEKTDFLSESLIQKLSITPKRYPSSNSDLESLFRGLRGKTTVETIEYDFGIPYLENVSLGKYVDFISRKTGISDSKVIKAHIRNIIVKKNGISWIPNPKKSLFITWNNRNEKTSQ
ncbi:MAG TPA: class I SAM-dependent methyltransferase [Victivallales bacterium]|nr:class I SAM-dependent methyltransferase [Victivallales bacterium]